MWVSEGITSVSTHSVSVVIVSVRVYICYLNVL